MTLKTFLSLSPDTYKVLSYFYITIYENWIFNVRIIDKYLDITHEMFFKTLYLLKISNIVSFQIDKEKAKIYLTFGQSPIDLNIEDWPINLIILFNKIVFQNENEKLYDAVNFVYRNLGKYEDKTMNTYLNSEILIKKVEHDTERVKREAKKLRKQSRKIQEDKAKEIFQYFYTKYKKTHFIHITEKLKEEEIKEAKELCYQFPLFSVDFFKEGIDWFLDHKFHNSYIISIEKLRKNFSKFLKEHGIVKFDNEIKIQ